MQEYEVVVGNVGTVYRGTDRMEAMEAYEQYVSQSKNTRSGRAGGEDVTLFLNGEVWLHHEGPLSTFTMGAREVMMARRETKRREPEREADAGFAIGVYSQDLIEENARERADARYGDMEWFGEMLQAGLLDKNGEITAKGWDQLNEDVRRIEMNSMAWMRRKFISARDEGHGGHGGEELIGTFWFDPHNPDHAQLVELARPGNERIDMSDASYGDLANTVFDGVSDFGASVLGGAINFFDIKPEDMEIVEQTMEQVYRHQQAARTRRAHEPTGDHGPRLVTGALSEYAKRVHAGEYRGVRFEVYYDPAPPRGALYAGSGYHYAAVVYTPYESARHGRGVEAEQIGFEPNTQGAQRMAEQYIDRLLRPEPPVGHGPDLEDPRRRRMAPRRSRRTR